ncbi:E3 ubiquitin-protein ligase ring1 [Thalictrum thalictroides]|uniref:E3 ubiquitin-protein ligase ring1 n=1 Tax=Thalictrum thalictroides TaxID=46969 RepID=A0A7J6WPV7_THATH|nr:E3 ubiquitin-protein ligase ring1 [Thalictrum thalictroides]
MAQPVCVYQLFKLAYHAEYTTSSSSSDSHEDTKALFRIIVKEKRRSLEQSASGRLVMAEEDIPAVENEFRIVYVHMCTPVVIEYMITRRAAASLINLNPLYRPMILKYISTSTNEFVEYSMNDRPKHLYVDVNLELTSYLCHPDEETLIQSALQESINTYEQNRYGSIPASRTSIEELKLKKFVKDESKDVCSICREEFFVDMEVAEMPCLHIYHKPCIVQWLEIKNVCPLCRHEMPIDD